jgi:hypothetical protein
MPLPDATSGWCWRHWLKHSRRLLAVYRAPGTPILREKSNTAPLHLPPPCLTVLEMFPRSSLQRNTASRGKKGGGPGYGGTSLTCEHVLLYVADCTGIYIVIQFIKKICVHINRKKNQYRRSVRLIYRHRHDFLVNVAKTIKQLDNWPTVPKGISSVKF